MRNIVGVSKILFDIVKKQSKIIMECVKEWAMGFENDYERGLCDPVWGKPLRNFKNGSVDDCATLIEKSLCNELRDGMLSDIRPLVTRFRDVFEQSYNGSIVSASKEESFELRAYEFFRSLCSDVAECPNSSSVNQQFFTLAAEKLCDFQCTPERFFETNARRVMEELTTDLLRWFATDRLNPAVEIRARLIIESPQDVEVRLDEILGAVRFGEIIKQVLESDKPVRAPRTRRVGLNDRIDIPVGENG